MNIAIIRLSSLGDIITTLVFLNYLKIKENGITITWIVDSNFRAILEYSPYIDNIIDIPLRNSKKNKRLLLEVIKKIRSLGEFDKVIDAQGLLKSAIIGKMLKKREFIGYDKFSIREKIASYFYNKKVYIPYDKHILKRQYELFKAAFSWKEDFSLSMLGHRAKAIGSNAKLNYNVTNHPKILFILEASKKEKEYPLASFYNLALELKNYYKNCKIFLIWDRKKDEIKELSTKDDVFYLLPHLSFDEIKALLKDMDLVIGGDTGITHLAWALNTKSITLYGNTPIERFKLEGDGYVSISSKVQTQIAKGDFSIQEISTQTILQSAKKLLDSSSVESKQECAQNLDSTSYKGNNL